jgi:hypothetical protein
MSDITPKYTDEELFTMIEMTFGTPPCPKAPAYSTPAERKREADYYNEVTSFLMAVKPHADIVWVSDTRRRFHAKHGIFHFDSA